LIAHNSKETGEIFRREKAPVESGLYEVQKFILKFTSPYVNKASDWSLNKNKPTRGFVYIRACEFHYELLNFTTKFGTKFATFTEKLYEINCKSESLVGARITCKKEFRSGPINAFVDISL
jgi:hypothetical protein